MKFIYDFERFNGFAPEGRFESAIPDKSPIEVAL